MKNNKYIKCVLSILSFLTLFSVAAYAAGPRLVTVTANTWAENHHEGYWSDTYVGKLSINGFERYRENGVDYYPMYVSITYDVQGEITKAKLNAEGGKTVKKSITVKDKWNNGPKTKVYHSYEGYKATNHMPMSDVKAVDE